jgi:hypothetical protein
MFVTWVCDVWVYRNETFYVLIMGLSVCVYVLGIRWIVRLYTSHRFARMSLWLSKELTTEHSSSWEAASHSASRQIPRILWKPIVLYRVHMTQPVVSILSQMSPVHIFSSIFLRFILVKSYHLLLVLPSGFLLQGFRPKFFYSSHLCHACYMAAWSVRFNDLLRHNSVQLKDMNWRNCTSHLQ